MVALAVARKPVLWTSIIIMDSNQLQYLVKRYFDENITEEEQQELATIIQKAKTDVQLKKVLEETWENYEPQHRMPEDTSNRILLNLFSPSHTQEHDSIPPASHNADFSIDDNRAHLIRRIPAWKYISIAASVAFILFFTWKFTNKAAVPAVNHTHIVSTQKGSRLQAKLPDGTTVWLNAGSHLEYDDHYGKVVRNVFLTGEAFFDVTHNKEKPFIIHTTAMDLKVLGTTFNVRAYPEEKRTEAALITGMLEVSFSNQPEKKVVLKPAEKISVSNDKNATDSVWVESSITADKPIMSVSSVTYQPGDSSVVETSWTKNKLVFRNKTFEEITMEMSRWYNVNFEVHDKNLLARRFTGTFETETISDALTRLSESYKFWFVYDKQKNVFIINK